MTTDTKAGKICCTLVIGLMWSQSVFAIPLTPGAGGFLSGVVPPTGVVLDSANRSFQLFDDISLSTILATGSVESKVIREDPTGFLRFEHKLFVDSTSPGHVEFLIAFNFGPFTTDIDFTLGGSGDVAPTEAIRSINTFAASFIFPGSGFGGGLQPGESSLPLLIRTNATEFDTNGIVRVQQNLDIEDLTHSFQPVLSSATPVPEPSTLLLFSSGMAVVLIWGWKRRKNEGRS